MKGTIDELHERISLLNKKQIESVAEADVEEEAEGGFLKALHELVTSNRILAYFTTRTSALRKIGLDEMKGSKKENINGAEISTSATPGSWTINDPYIEQLEAELKLVKDKCKLADDKDRVHITLSGEEIFLVRGIKTGGGETLKIAL